MHEQTHITTPRLWTTKGFRRDRWRAVPDSIPLPTGFVVISLQRWRSEWSALRGNPAISVGLHLAPDDGIDTIADQVQHLELIALTFPRFTDGRGYSMARRLREQLRFKGELRATGDVLFDQLPLMLRCGFDSFEISDAATINALERRTPDVVTNCARTVARHDQRRGDGCAPATPPAQP